MAEPNISLLGATYSGVKGVTLPKSGGGTATFPWVEGSETKTANGTYDVTNLAQLIVNVAGGGGSGLVYETGEYKPSANVAKVTIPFANTHTVAPFFYVVADVTETASSTTADNLLTLYVNFHQYFGNACNYGGTSYLYGLAATRYKSSSTGTNGTTFVISNPYTNSSDATNGYSRYWAKETGILAYTNSNSRYWRSGRTYKWIAVWKP